MSRLMIVEVPSYTSEFKGIREVQELVRCGECKYYLPMQKNLPYAMRRRYCNKGAIKATSPDDFCSWGERTDDEDTGRR